MRRDLVRAGFHLSPMPGPPGDRPLVLLHGFTGSARAWDPVLAPLPRGGRAVAVALPGHDPASLVLPGEGFTGAVDRLARALRAAGLLPAALAGYSMGGRLALGLAARHPRAVARLVVIGAHPGLPRGAERRRRREEDLALARRLERIPIAAFVREWEARPLFATQRRLAAPLLERQRAERLRHRPRRLARAVRALGTGGQPDLRRALARFHGTLVAMAGALDERYAALAETLARRAPRGRVVLVPDVGHNLLLEAPAAVARELFSGMAPRAGERCR